MNQEHALKIPALNIEEAAQLPALSRHADGGAALEAVRRAAARMGEKQVSNAVSTAALSAEKQSVVPASVPRQPSSRASLYHVLRRGRKQGGGR